MTGIELIGTEVVAECISDRSPETERCLCVYSVCDVAVGKETLLSFLHFDDGSHEMFSPPELCVVLDAVV